MQFSELMSRLLAKMVPHASAEVVRWRQLGWPELTVVLEWE